MYIALLSCAADIVRRMLRTAIPLRVAAYWLQVNYYEFIASVFDRDSLQMLIHSTDVGVLDYMLDYNRS